MCVRQQRESLFSHSQKLEKGRAQPTYPRSVEVSAGNETEIPSVSSPTWQKNESKAIYPRPTVKKYSSDFPVWVETWTQRQTEAQLDWQLEREK